MRLVLLNIFVFDQNGLSNRFSTTFLRNVQSCRSCFDDLNSFD